MTIFIQMFSYFGIACAAIVFIVAVSAYIIRQLMLKKLTVWKVVISVTAVITLTFVASFVFLYDFPEPSGVDTTPLTQIGDARIDDFGARQAQLEESPYFLRSNHHAFNYRFRFQNLPNVYVTIYPMADQETAHENLLIAARVQGTHGIQSTLGTMLAGFTRTRNISRLSDSVYVNTADSFFVRTRDSYFTKDLDRRLRTQFIIDDVLFTLEETGDRELIGESTSMVIEILCDIFIN